MLYQQRRSQFRKPLVKLHLCRKLADNSLKFFHQLCHLFWLFLYPFLRQCFQLSSCFHLDSSRYLPARSCFLLFLCFLLFEFLLAFVKNFVETFPEYGWRGAREMKQESLYKRRCTTDFLRKHNSKALVVSLIHLPFSLFGARSLELVLFTGSQLTNPSCSYFALNCANMTNFFSFFLQPVLNINKYSHTTAQDVMDIQLFKFWKITKQP